MTRSTLVITGAASGIGLAVLQSETLGNSFERVVALDISPPREDLVDTSIDRIWVAADVRDAVAVDEAIVELADAEAPYAGLVNSAGNHRVGDSLMIPLDEFREIIEVHLLGTFLVSRSVARLMTHGGSIVNLSSVGAQFGLPHRAAYSAAKAGIEGLTRALAVEWASRGIRVNAVAPGYIDTPMGLKGVADRKATEQLHALHRLGTPDEVGELISYLLSDKASFITGGVIPIDGGYSVFKGPS